MTLEINKTIDAGYEVFTFTNRGTKYEVLKKIGTLGGIDVFTNRLARAGAATLKCYNNIEEFEATAKFLKGISKLID